MLAVIGRSIAGMVIAAAEAQVTAERDSLRSDFAAASHDAYVLKTAHDTGVDPAQLAQVVPPGSTPEQIAQGAERVRMGQSGGFNGGQVGVIDTSPKRTPDQILPDAVSVRLRPGWLRRAGSRRALTGG